MVALIACGLGLLIISFTTVTLIRLLNFNFTEQRSFEEIELNKRKKEVDELRNAFMRSLLQHR